MTRAPTVINKYNRDDEFKSVVKQLPIRATPLPPVRQAISPSGDTKDDVSDVSIMILIPVAPQHTSPSPSYGLRPPAPTPFSLFQSVPENFQETDVFHLSQNVDFGKKLGVGSVQPSPPDVAYNEVDTGLETRGVLKRLNVLMFQGVFVARAPPVVATP